MSDQIMNTLNRDPHTLPWTLAA